MPRHSLWESLTKPAFPAIRELNTLCSEPKLTQYDQWGRRIDHLQTSEAWRALKEIAIKEGLVAISYERKFQEFSRIWGFSKAMIFQGDSNVVSEPFSPDSVSTLCH